MTSVNFNSQLNLIILITGMMLFSVSNLIASYSYKYLQPLGKTTEYIFAFEFVFGILVYCIKIPLYYYFAKQNIVNITIIFMAINGLIILMYSYFILKEKVAIHSIIIFTSMIGLTMLNEYLNAKGHKTLSNS